MKAIADLSLIPVRAGLCLSDYIAACEQVLGDAGLKCGLHAEGSNIALASLWGPCRQVFSCHLLMLRFQGPCKLHKFTEGE